MKKLSDIIDPLIKLKETVSDEYKDVIDDSIETIKWLSVTVKNQKEKIINAEQISWERNTAVKQLEELGYRLGEQVTIPLSQPPMKTGEYLGKICIHGDIYWAVVTYDGINWEFGNIKLIAGETILEYRKLPSAK